MGLTLVLDANVNDYSVTNGKFDGFKVIDVKTTCFRRHSSDLRLRILKQVLAHTDEHFPDISDRGFVLGVGTETYITI